MAVNLTHNGLLLIKISLIILVILTAVANPVGQILKITMEGLSIETQESADEFARLLSGIASISLAIWSIEFIARRSGVSAVPIPVLAFLMLLPFTGFFVAVLVETTPYYAGHKPESLYYGTGTAALVAFAYCIVRITAVVRWAAPWRRTRRHALFFEYAVLFIVVGDVFAIALFRVSWDLVLLSAVISLLVTLGAVSLGPVSE